MNIKLKNFFSLTLSFLIIISLLYNIDLKNMFKSLVNVNVFYYLIGLMFYFLSYYCRALRLRVLFNENIFQFINIISVHMFFNHFLPFRTGELALPYYLKKITNIQYSKSISLMILLRLFDFLAIFLTFIIFIPLLFDKLNMYLIIIVFVLFILNCILIRYIQKIFLILNKLFRIFFPLNFYKRFEKHFININNALTIEKKLLFPLFVYSFLDRCFNYLMTIFLIIGLSYKIRIIKIILANAVASVTNILPINTIGSFGTLELGWSGALMLFKIPKEIAIASGFNFHILALTYTVFLGIAGYSILTIFNERIKK